MSAGYGYGYGTAVHAQEATALLSSRLACDRVGCQRGQHLRQFTRSPGARPSVARTRPKQGGSGPSPLVHPHRQGDGDDLVVQEAGVRRRRAGGRLLGTVGLRPVAGLAVRPPPRGRSWATDAAAQPPPACRPAAGERRAGAAGRDRGSHARSYRHRALGAIASSEQLAAMHARCDVPQCDVSSRAMCPPVHRHRAAGCNSTGSLAVAD